MLRPALVALVLVPLAVIPALARGSAEATARELLRNPRSYEGRTIVVRRIRCVDPGPAGFVCEATNSGRRLRLDGSGLGPITPNAVAEKLQGPCKGMAALSRPGCTFDAIITPTGFGAEDGATVIHGQEIDIVPPRRP